MGDGAAAASGNHMLVSERAQSSARAAAAAPETPKPLEDPKVHEVVSQDLATQEVKRVRRKENSPPAPPPAAPAERHQAQGRGGASEAREGGKGGGKGDEGSGVPPAAEVMALVNGMAPSEQQRPQANGRVADYDFHEMNQRQGEKSSRGEVGNEGSARGSGSEPSGARAGTKGEGEDTLASKAGAGADDAGSGAVKSSGTDTEAIKEDGSVEQPNCSAVVPAESSSSIYDAKRPPPPAAAELARITTTPSAPTEHAFSAPTKACPYPSSSPPGGEDKGGVFPSANATRDESLASAGWEATKSQAIGSARDASQAHGKRLNPQAMDEAKRMKGVAEKGEEGKEVGAGTALGAAVATKRNRCPCPDHVLPVARTFFDFEAVSGLEMRMLPEFFTGQSASKTPEVRGMTRHAVDSICVCVYIIYASGFFWPCLLEESLVPIWNVDSARNTRVSCMHEYTAR